MRAVFHGERDQLGGELATMCGLAGDAMEKASAVVLGSDLALAEQVIGADAQLAVLRARCEEHTFRLLSLQAPVARDLRLVVTGVQVAEKIERMGSLACHVAQTARRRHPACAVPAQLADRFAEMGRLAVVAARGVQQIIAVPVQEHLADSNDVMTGWMSCTAKSSPRCSAPRPRALGGSWWPRRPPRSPTAPTLANLRGRPPFAHSPLQLRCCASCGGRSSTTSGPGDRDAGKVRPACRQRAGDFRTDPRRQSVSS